MTNKTLLRSALVLLAVTAFFGATSLSQAQVQIDHTDTFTGNNSSFSIDFTAIGNAGNTNDTTGYGAVGYNYNIGTYDISQSQIDAAGISGVTAGAWSGLQPAANISWYQAAAFVNFLNTSTGHQAAYNLTYSGGSYTMALWASGQTGYDASNPFRNSLAHYFLPSENEWYKAAYYNAGSSSYNLYPTGNSVPTRVISGTTAGTAVFTGHGVSPTQPALVTQAGGASSYGTMGQGGNVDQWMESPYNAGDTNLANGVGFRGGYWSVTTGYIQSSFRGLDYPDDQVNIIGFRVASIDLVPEPSTYALFGLGALVLIIAYGRSRKNA